MSNIYNDEMLKKSKKQGDTDNYNLIKQYQDDYKKAEAIGDTEGMEKAHKSAEAIRATYGYTGGASGNAYASLTPNNTNSSFFGNAYEDITKMQKEGFDAYKDMVNTQKQGLIDSVSRGKNQINENYTNAYKDLMLEEKKTLDKLPEDMAKLGLYGSGTGETAYSKIKAGYAGELKKLLADKNKALTDIDNQIADLENQNATQIAQYYSDMMRQNPELYLSMLDSQYNEMLNDRNYNYQLDRDKKLDKRYDNEWEYKLEQDKKTEEKEKINNAWAVAEATGDYSQLVELGQITSETASRMQNLINSKMSNTPTVKSYSGIKASKSYSINSGTQLEIPSDIAKKAASIENDGERFEYITEMVDQGYLSDEQGFYLVNINKASEQLPLTERTWTMTDNGGINGFYGIDNNGKVKDQYGNEYSMETLYNELKKTMGKEAAKQWVIDLQYKVGIDVMK